MFPENLHFDGKAYRTLRINEGVNLIYQKMKDLEGEKKRDKSKKSGFVSYGAPNEIRTHIVGTGNRNSIH